MCSGALRHYLLEMDALPSQSLIAMVPVSLKLDARPQSADASGGNAVGTIMVKLATDEPDPGGAARGASTGR